MHSGHPADRVGADRRGFPAAWLHRLQLLDAGFGAGAPAPLSGETATGLLLFSLAQTPEPEVHGQLLRSLDASWIPVADASAFRARLGEEAPERLAERRRLWEETAAGARRRLAVVDLEDTTPEEIARLLAAAAGPGG